jgi:predicted Zn-dependent peptidase
MLDNGLTVIVHRDPFTPMVAMNVIYKVGSRDENPDKTGFAHLFEHLMFGGSANIPKYDEPLQQAGGDNNAFTNNDYTNYYLTIPKNNIETAFWLESDRMLSLAFSEKSLGVQQQVVIEEFKQNYLNQPYGDVYLLLKPMVYKVHPYQWNTIGKDIGHIENATMDDVKSFYKKYYKPNNAILSVAGDVTVEQIKKLAEKWFGNIPAGEEIRRNYPGEPEQKSARYMLVERHVPQNALYMVWLMAARNDSSFYATDIISDILSNGKSARLFQNLVKKYNLFSEINAFITGDIDRGLFMVSGKLMNGESKESAVQAVVEELMKMTTHDVDQRELHKIKNKIETTLVFSRMSVLNKAMYLGYYEMLGDANNWNKETARYQQVTAEEIRQTAGTLFAQHRQNTLFYQAMENRK